MHARRLATAAALALATTALVGAAPPPGTAPPPGIRTTAGQPAGSTEVPVERGTARFRVPAALLARLAARGVVPKALGTKGALGPHTAHDGSRTLSLRLSGGAVTNSGGKAGGELRFGAAGLALVHAKAHKTVRLTRFTAELGQGTLSAGTGRGTRITLGSFPRADLRSALDTRTRVLRLKAPVTLSASAAERLNKALATKAFTRGTRLLDVRVTASLDRTADLRTALNLHGRRSPASTKARRCPPGCRRRCPSGRTGGWCGGGRSCSSSPS
ncbi:hypothetical protein [Streptomyces nigrescens]|uniref:hypothetical protein n=1 Tax=Streptomyces nigrescens TaxID=1920 RepID=UPI0029057993|nr:hypothetical protein [Streptomyces nigrescens]